MAHAMVCACLVRQAGVFGAFYLKKIPALVFQKELIEVPLLKEWLTSNFF
jgi:hypothetical protein